MDPALEDLTTFKTRYSSFKYKVLPFGLTNRPASFQRFINLVLNEYLDKFYIVFVDDMLIYSEDPLEHKVYIKKVLQRLREAGLQAAIYKCEFSVIKTRFLGFIIGIDGIQTDLSKVSTIIDWEIPTTKTSIRSFLGFCNFYWRFIRNYSRIIRPMNQLLRDDVEFK